MRGFYSTYDHKEKRFGFAPHSLSTKKSPQRGEVPLEELPVVLGVWDYVIIGIAIVVLLTIVILILYYFCCLPLGYVAKVEIKEDQFFKKTEVVSLLQELNDH